jgi:hypothetical protein
LQARLAGDHDSFDRFPEAPEATELLEHAFGLTSALSQYCTQVRLRDTAPNLVPAALDGQFLITKDQLKTLEERKRLESACGKGKGKGNNRVPWSSPSFSHPYNGGKGRGKGKGGKGQPKFTFPEPQPH